MESLDFHKRLVYNDDMKTILLASHNLTEIRRYRALFKDISGKLSFRVAALTTQLLK